LADECFLPFVADVTIVVFKAGSNTKFKNATINFNGSNYVGPITFSLAPGTIMNVSASYTGFTTENKVITVSDVSGLATQQITFIISAILVSTKLLCD
jgi:hypothetical protein